MHKNPKTLWMVAWVELLEWQITSYGQKMNVRLVNPEKMLNRAFAGQLWQVGFLKMVNRVYLSRLTCECGRIAKAVNSMPCRPCKIC